MIGKRMRRWLKSSALTVPTVICSIHMVTRNYNYSPRGPSAFFWLVWAPITHVVHRYTGRQNNNTHKMTVMMMVAVVMVIMTLMISFKLKIKVRGLGI